MALLPMGSSAFLAGLPKQQLQEMLIHWEEQRAKAGDQSRPILDLVLHGLYRALGREKERQEAAARLKDRQVGNVTLSVESDLDKAIVTLHNQMRDQLLRR